MSIKQWRNVIVNQWSLKVRKWIIWSCNIEAISEIKRRTDWRVIERWCNRQIELIKEIFVWAHLFNLFRRRFQNSSEQILKIIHSSTNSLIKSRHCNSEGGYLLVSKLSFEQSLNILYLPQSLKTLIKLAFMN